MRFRVLLGMMLCVLGMGLVGQAQEHAELKAQATNMAWLALMDAGKYGEARDAAAAMVKAAVTKDVWEQTMVGARSPLGKVMQRDLSTARSTKSLPGAPDGEYVVTEYRTRFEHKAQAVEMVVTTREADGVWRVAGYHFK